MCFFVCLLLLFYFALEFWGFLAMSAQATRVICASKSQLYIDHYFCTFFCCLLSVHISSSLICGASSRLGFFFFFSQVSFLIVWYDFVYSSDRLMDEVLFLRHGKKSRFGSNWLCDWLLSLIETNLWSSPLSSRVWLLFYTYLIWVMRMLDLLSAE